VHPRIPSGPASTHIISASTAPGPPRSQRLPLAWRRTPDAPEETVTQLLPGAAAGMPPGDASAPIPAARDHDGFFYALLHKPT